MSGSDSDHPAVPAPLTTRQRGRARRRLRYLRGVRELQLRDLGGFIFDLYRYGEQREPLVRGKLDAIIATDEEIRSLEELLGDTDRAREVRQPGVGGTCANCGAFHATNARFCSACGMDLAVAAAAAAAVESHARETAHEEWQDAAQPEPSSEPWPAAAEASSGAAGNGVDVDPAVAEDGAGEAAAPDPGEAVPEPGDREAVQKGDTGESDPASTGESDPADTDTGEVAAVGARRERSGRREPFRGRGRFRR